MKGDSKIPGEGGERERKAGIHNLTLLNHILKIHILKYLTD